MCGICGFIGGGDRDDLVRMGAMQRHRGPDADGQWTDATQTVWLGHQRLSILDLAGGAQPMASADGQLVVVFNGEIYNHRDLRRDLANRGHEFRTDHSDTEVLLHGYREWGEALPTHLNGMWAFVIYDAHANRLFASRDRFGKKPLYYARQNESFVFASELSSLIQHRAIAANLSLLSLQKYFAYGYIPAPHSIFQQIEKLPGGCNLIVDVATRSHRVMRYWEFLLEPFADPSPNGEEQWAQQLRELIDRAVRRRLEADVPLGVFLSGGIDSTSIAAFAAQALGGDAVQTFAIGFDEPTFDESRYSQQAADFLGTRHHLERLSLTTAQTLLPTIVNTLDEPMGDSSLIPTYLLCRAARKHVTVALGGDGADELFAGYDPFRALSWARWYERWIPAPIHQAIRMVMARLPVSHTNLSWEFKIKTALRGLSYPPCMWSPVWLGPLEPRDLSEFFAVPVDIENVYSEAIELWDKYRHLDLVDRTLQFYTNLYLQNDILVKIDRASMMNSLEVRAPYLDIDVVNFVRRIPSRYKFHRGQTKVLLKKALATVVPETIRNRAKKGFGVPLGEWFRLGALTTSENGRIDGTRDEFVRQMADQHRRGLRDNRSFLWNHWLLTTWLEESRRCDC